MEQILFALWFFLPVGVANTAPILAAKIPFLTTFNHPIDFGATVGGKPIFGAHKTWRGLIAGIISAIIVIYLQQLLYIYHAFFRPLSIDYATYNPIILGTLCALGALLGDAVESFFKRRVGIKPGKPWIPFDQIDYIIGGILMTAFYIRLPLFTYGMILLLWFGMHLLFSYIGYLLGLKEEPI